jgi:hypothetical protein
MKPLRGIRMKIYKESNFRKYKDAPDGRYVWWAKDWTTDSTRMAHFDVQFVKHGELLMWLAYPENVFQNFNALDPVPDTFTIGSYILYEDALEYEKSEQAKLQAARDGEANSSTG